MASSSPSCQQIPADQKADTKDIISVQELIKDLPNFTTLPQCYVRNSDQSSPINKNDQVFTEVPSIDMQKLLAESDDSELEKLHSTCKEWGIFQLVNHGVMSTAMENLKQEIEGFYKLPIEEKLRFKIRPGEVEGYGTAFQSGRKYDWCDRFFIITNPIHTRKPHLFPELHSSLRNALESYISELQNLGMKLLRLMAKALKIELKEMEKFEDGMQTLRMTYYPPCPQPELVTGIIPHSDASTITFLLQVNGVKGLEIKKDGVWFPISFRPDALVVNVGDILEILSNGVYHSVEHKVTVNSEKERISIAFFINPKFEADVGPSTSLISNQNPPLFKTVGMENYVKTFFTRQLHGRSYLDFFRI